MGLTVRSLCGFKPTTFRSLAQYSSTEPHNARQEGCFTLVIIAILAIIASVSAQGLLHHVNWSLCQWETTELPKEKKKAFPYRKCESLKHKRQRCHPGPPCSSCPAWVCAAVIEKKAPQAARTEQHFKSNYRTQQAECEQAPLQGWRRSLQGARTRPTCLRCLC